MYQKQVQVLEPKLKTRDSYRLEDYIDISHALASPVTVFISKRDYEDLDTNVIHMFSYSMGKERVITWAAYLRNENKVVFDGACKFNSFAFIDYQNRWQKRDFAPLSAQVENRFTKRINNYLGNDAHPLIKTRTDYKALLLYKSWYEDEINDADFVALFALLDQNDTLYKYERIHSARYDIDNILIAFFEIIYKREYEYGLDEEISDYMAEIADRVHANLFSYEGLLNVNQMLGRYQYDKDAKKIGDAFELAIARSKFASPEVMDLLEECPLTDEDCWGELRDEKSPCAIYTYGEYSFHDSDLRHPTLDLR